MKRLIFLMAVVLMFGVGSARGAGFALMELVPKDIDGCLWLDLKQITAQPMLREQLDRPMVQDRQELRGFREIFEGQGLDLYQSFPVMVAFGRRNGSGALLLQSAVTEEQFRNLLNAEGNFDIAGKVGGRTVYALSQQGEPDAGRGPMKRCGGVAMYLRADVLILAKDLNGLDAYQQEVATGETMAANPVLADYQQTIAAGAAAWVVFAVPELAVPTGGPEHSRQRPNLMNSIQGGALAIHLGNAADPQKQDDIRLVMRMACKDANGAMFGAMAFNGMMMMGIGQALAGDPELGTQMSQLLQLRPEQQNIVLDATLTGDLVRRLQTAITKRMQSPEAKDGGFAAGEGHGELQPVPPPSGDAPVVSPAAGN